MPGKQFALNPRKDAALPVAGHDYGKENTAGHTPLLPCQPCLRGDPYQEFPISLWFHFAYMIISIAMLGLAASGVMLALYPA